jgi:hypothetical protein
MWRRVRTELQWLRTATPATAGVRRDVTVIRDLLQTVTTGGASASRAAPMLLRATDSFCDVATWSSHVVHMLGQTGQLYVIGSAIPRDLASEDARLAEAKLQNTLATAPASMLVRLEEVLQAAAGTKPARSHASTSGHWAGAVCWRRGPAPAGLA